MSFSARPMALMLAIVLCVPLAARAEGVSPALPAPQPGGAAGGASMQAETPRVLTLKERLGAKWKDEQRVDNCKVPVEKRGVKPRPEGCSHGKVK